MPTKAMQNKEYELLRTKYRETIASLRNFVRELVKQSEYLDTICSICSEARKKLHYMDCSYTCVKIDCFTDSLTRYYKLALFPDLFSHKQPFFI